MHFSIAEIDSLEYYDDLGTIFNVVVSAFNKRTPTIDTLSVKIVNGNPFLSIEIPTVYNPEASINGMSAIIGAGVTKVKGSYYLLMIVIGTQSTSNIYISDVFDSLVKSIKAL